MHAHFLDPYQPRSSPIHAFDAWIKLVLTVVFIFANALLPVGAWPVYILMFSLVLAVEVLSELGVAYVLKRSILAIPFVFAALPLLFTVPGLPLVSFSIGSWDLSISQAGLERFISIGLKSWISLQAAIVIGLDDHVSEPADGDAGDQDPAPAGLGVRLDVALPVCAGG